MPRELPSSKPREPVAAAGSETGREWIDRLAIAYVSCMAIIVAWLAWGAIAAWRSCRCASLAPQCLQDELAQIAAGGRLPQLLVSSRVKTAAALGLFRPAILLPAALVEECPRPALCAVLRHERAHIQSGDLWLLALGRLLLVVLFAHPLFWWLRRAIRRDQELLADAAAAGDQRHAYAEELLQLVRRTSGPAGLFGAVGIWENSSQLSRRIAMLLQDSFRVQPRTTPRWRVFAICLFAIVAFGMSLLTLRPGHALAQEQKPAVNPANAPRTNNPRSGEARAPTASDAIKAGEVRLENNDLDGAIGEFTKAIQRSARCPRLLLSRLRLQAEAR